METTTKKDLFTALTDVGQHAAMAQAVGRAILQLLPDEADAYEGAEDVRLLLCALLDELDREHEAIEDLDAAYRAERNAMKREEA